MPHYGAPVHVDQGRNMRGSWCAVAIAIGLTLSGCTGGAATGSGDSTSTADDGPVACGAANAPPCVPIPSTRALDSPCGDITAEMVSSALGRPATLVSSGWSPSGCLFSAGPFQFGFETAAYDPYVTGVTLAGASPPSNSFLTNDRSGSWYVMGQLTAHDVTYTYRLTNNGRGSDTYPPIDGPEQRPITRAAADALVTAISGSG